MAAMFLGWGIGILLAIGVIEIIIRRRPRVSRREIEEFKQALDKRFRDEYLKRAFEVKAKPPEPTVTRSDGLSLPHAAGE